MGTDKDDLALLISAAALAVGAVAASRSGGTTVVQSGGGGATSGGAISSPTVVQDAPYIETLTAASSRDLSPFTGNLAQVEVQWAFGGVKYYLFDNGTIQTIRSMAAAGSAGDITVTFASTPGSRQPRVNNVSGSGYEVMIQYTKSNP